MAASDHTLIIWDAIAGTHSKTLQGHTEGVNDIAWSSDSLCVASASDDYSVRIWNVKRVCLVPFRTLEHTWN
jgi:COMPASS component SWD3